MTIKETKSTSVFAAEDGISVITMTLIEGKKFLNDIVDRNDTLKTVTKTKAKNSINRCKNPTDLSTMVFSWMLAHPSEGMKVLK